MFCRNCGKLLPDDAKVCPYCNHETRKTTTRQHGEDKHGLGIFMGLFLGLIGLIIGLLMYSTGTDERETFFGGWVAGFVISIVIAGVIIFISPMCASCALSNINYR